MDESGQGSLSQSKTIKAEEIITSKSKPKKSDSSFLKKLLHLITCIVDLFITLFDKIYSLFSDCSLVTQFSILLIPLSILMILIIYNIHVQFYTDIYDFNFSKTYKEEFLDPFMTQIDDLKSELTAIIIKDSKLDFENQLFFQIYFRELASVGFFKKEPNKKFLDDVNKDKYYSLFSQLNYFNNMDANFVLEKESSKIKIDKRDTDQLGELGKIYYYIFPYIWYQSISINSIINQSFFIAYELGGKNYSVDENYFFFRYPRNSEGFKINDNFIRSNNALNPQIFSSGISDTNMKGNNNYNFDNWYMMPDYKFRESINFEEDKYYYKISLAHLNAENDGNINKTFITYSQQYIKCNERYFFINIIFFKNQINLKEGDNDYSSFIVKDNYTKGIDERIGVIYDKHSDNISYVLTLSDITEYSLTETDYKFFHLGLYENNEIYYMNGILFDSFSLDYLYDHSKYYTSTRVGAYDIKYFVTLYLYKSLFQNIRFKEISSVGNKEDAINWIQDIVKEANALIYKYVSMHKESSGMGTTLVLAILSKTFLLVGNIGDSSGYVIKNKKLHKVTVDHTLVNLLVKSGELSEKEAKNHPKKNVLMRALGASVDVEVDIFNVELGIDGIFLCSDGLTNMLDDNTIEKILNSDMTIEEKLDKLVFKANNRGGSDNISIAYLNKEDNI